MLEVLSTAIAGTRAFRHTGLLDRARLTLTYLVDVDEHERRVDCGLKAVSDEFLLVGLMSLPSDDLGLVNDRFAKVLHAPTTASAAAVVEDPDGGLWAQRRLSVPVEILEIEIQSPNWKRGCAAAHRWAGYGRRVVRTDRVLSQFEMAEAAHYGIGVVVGDGERVLEPGPFVPERWSSARWRIAELVYEQFLDQRH